MANYIGSEASGFNSTDLWIPNTGVSTNERFEGLISSTTGVGTRTETYSRFVFESGGLTYEYEGQWTLTASIGLVTNTVAAGGTYNSVTVRSSSGTVVAQATGLSFPVDFGAETSLTLIDLLNPILGPVLTLLFGGGTAESLANLHTDATSNIQELAFQGADSLQGGAQADVLVGHTGNDTLNGGAGADRLDGGLGDDVYYIDDFSDVVVDAGGNDRVIISVAGYDLSLLSGIETVVQSPRGSGNDTVIGGDVNDGIDGGDGDDALAGGAGNDSLSGGNGHDALEGGSGNDVHAGGAGADTMAGGAGDDTYEVDDPGDLVNEGIGQGTDTVYSSIHYALGANVENLVLQGSARTGYGNELSNIIFGTPGDDALFGLAGNDSIFALSGNDTVQAGSGNDTIHGAFGRDKLYGSSGNDRIYGETGNDTISGGTGNDYLYGGSGKDAINGLAGNDRIDSGYGNDVLSGGSGKDSFFFTTVLSSGGNVDRISGFSVRDDNIRLDNAIFKALGTKTGRLKEDFFTIGTAAQDANDHIIYDSAKGALYYDADGVGGRSAVKFATLSKNLAMTEKDFYVI
jgi:Ca2+-binding RTX toxin-like protein